MRLESSRCLNCSCELPKNLSIDGLFVITVGKGLSAERIGIVVPEPVSRLEIGSELGASFSEVGVRGMLDSSRELASERGGSDSEVGETDILHLSAAVCLVAVGDN